MGALDFAEIMTAALALVVIILAAASSWIAGYQSGALDAVGKARQTFAIEIARLRHEHRLFVTRKDSDEDGGAGP